jgi:hypothetical protein
VRDGNFLVDADIMIVTTGETPDLSFCGNYRNGWLRRQADGLGRTNMAGVYTGDAASLSRLTIRGDSAGKRSHRDRSVLTLVVTMRRASLHYNFADLSMAEYGR